MTRLLRHSVDCRDVVRALGIDIDRAGFMRCVWHQDGGRRNARVYRDGIKCYRCGHHGDAIDVVRTVRGYSFKEAVEWLKRNMGATDDTQSRITQRRNRYRPSYY